MKFRLPPRVSQAISLCALACLATVATQLSAQINFTDFSSTSGLQLNGNAAQATNSNNQQVLRLTPDGLTGAAGSAWFTTQQPVSSGFTSTFTFQVTSALGAADGFAFVIQNAPTSPLNSIGAAAGALGYGQGGNPGGAPGNGIQNSLAVEFDTFQNPWDPDGNHLALQSCAPDLQQPGPPTVPPGSNNQFHVPVDSNFDLVGEGGTVAFYSCTLPNGDGQALVSLSSLDPGINIADGAVHTVALDYEINCGGDCSSTLDVNIDGQDVFFGPVDLNLSDWVQLSGDTSAYVGFTGGSGALTENADILSWTFTPHTAMTITLPTPPGVTTVFNFGAFNFKSTPSQFTQNGNSLTITAAPLDPTTPIPFSAGSAKCIVYGNAGETCWTFDIACSGPDCGGTYDAEFATSYDTAPGNDYLSPGFGKGEFGNPGHDCNLPFAGTFQNQIDAFYLQRQDPTTKGTSGGTGSCWVATEDTPGIGQNTSGVVFNFVGFAPPVTNDAINLVQAGQAVPLSFQVFDENNQPISNLTLCTQQNPASCPSGSVDILDYPSNCSIDGNDDIGSVITAGGSGNSGLQNQGGGSYQFNWKTQKGWAKTCRTIQVNLLDGINHIAVFKFKN